MRSIQIELGRAATDLYRGIDTPRSLALSIMLKYGEYDQVASFSVAPGDYLCADSYFRDAAAAAFLRKNPFLPTTVDRRETALSKWHEGENQCKSTNLRLFPYEEGITHPDCVPGVLDFISQVRKKISEWIGPCPPDDLVGRFGPGSTYHDRGLQATVPGKISSDPTFTPRCVWRLPYVLETQWGRRLAAEEAKLTSVHGNRFTTAPKTSLTDRAIAVEPSINIFLQLAVGSELRRRLAARITTKAPNRAQWDLSRASDVHRQVAREASVSREFATLDLSNASDTLSRSLVRILMPRRWVELLEDLRSPKTLLPDGRWYVLEKFSSMGNGFTFELETIIFAAIAVCATQKVTPARLGKNVFVFGDDIIIPDDATRAVTACLKFFGFSLNKEKSFSGDSPFRESCGADFFNGVDVRPFFLKGPLDEPQRVIACANGVNRNLKRLASKDQGVRRAWLGLLDLLPRAIRTLRGPEQLGDIVIHDAEDRWVTKVRSSIRYIRTYRPHKHRSIKLERYSGLTQLASLTYGIRSDHPKGWFWISGIKPRDSVRSYKMGWVPFS